MPIKCQAQLQSKAQTFIKTLNQHHINAHLDDVSYNDYNAMLKLEGKGNIHIYYSPTNRAYKLGLHQFKDKNLQPIIEECWETITPPQPQPKQANIPQLAYQAYVDGSFQGGAVGYGLVILHNGQSVYEDYGTVDKHTEQQQITGELASTMRVIRWCEENNVPQIQIFYDFIGIEKWALGMWKAEKEAPIAYQKFMRTTQVKVVWQKVKSHSGDKWNDYVDKLAKRGSELGVQAKAETADQPENPLMIALEKSALEFITYLDENAIHAEFLQIYNEMFARIKIDNGLFDLYNTRKKPFSPVLSNFKDRALKDRVQTLWEQFRKRIS